MTGEVRRPGRHLVAAWSAVLLALGACADADAPTAPGSPGDRLATVEWDGGTPKLFLQRADGTGRVRVHFEDVGNHVTGNYPPRDLPVTDETILAIPRMKWSPDGRFLAVTVAPSHEALQVVLVTAEGRALRTVSPNSQYLWGDVEWSPDGSRIAYIMATTQQGGLPDLFVTELGPDRVTRVTTGSRLTGYDTIRFDASGQRLYFTEWLGWAEDDINGLARLASVDLASGTVTITDTVTGFPQGLSRDGSWALFERPSVGDPGVHELFRRAAGGSETVLASGAPAQAVILEGDREALVRVSFSPAPGDSFRIIGLERPGDVRLHLPTRPATEWAAFWQAGR